MVPKHFHFAVIPFAVNAGIYSRGKFHLLQLLFAMVASYYSTTREFSKLVIYINICKGRLHFIQLW